MGHLTEDMTRLVGEIKAGHAERVSFIRDLGQEVAAMREGFRCANEERTREVMALRQEVATDLKGARYAWFGPSPADHTAKAKEQRLARERAERERRAQEEAARLHTVAVKKAKGAEPEPKRSATKKK